MENLRRMVFTVCYITHLVNSSLIPGVVADSGGALPGGGQWLKSTSITHTSRDPGAGRGMHSRFRRDLNTDEMTFLVDDHNAKRRLEYASDMEHLKWNSELASMALDWAKGCLWGHGQPPRSNPPFSQIGQNLYATTARMDLAKAMRAWSDDEKVYYHYDTGACDEEPCGHYTQVVWSTSREVGCAEYFCPNLVNAFRNGNYLVCNYGPAGNIQGIKPFRVGERCTQCESGQFWCDNGLCRRDCTSSSNCYCGAKCQNQGCMTSDCTCKCQDGYTGSNCAERCEDKHANCGANPGWPLSWCEGNQRREYVRDMCPLMCGVCRAYTGNIDTCPTVIKSFPVWAIVFLVVLIIGAAVVFIIGGLYWSRRNKSQSNTEPTNRAPSIPSDTTLPYVTPMPTAGVAAKPEKPSKPARPPKPSRGLVQERIQGFDNSAYY